MRVTVERTFNLGNYENIRFTFDSEEGVQNGDHVKVAMRLSEDCHAAFEAYNRALKDMKTKIEDRVKQIVEGMNLGGLKPK
jgi:hypothetical protein